MAVITGLVALAGAASAQGATLQTIGGFSSPMYVTSPPAEPNRLLIVQRGGRIEQVRDGAVSNFADLEAQVKCCNGEQGLHSIALAPDFTATGRFYVAYTNLGDQLVVAEMRSSGVTASTATLREVVSIPHPVKNNHYGGQLQFGPEGLLYVSTGDGGGEDDELHNAQNPSSLLGKMLRIDPRQSGVLPYTVPAGNPIPGSPVWSLGMRNPYRFSFDAAGGLWIGDVGQSKVEEVDYAAAGAAGGANYGWNCFEGSQAGKADDPECATPPPGGYVAPVFEYPHADPGGGKAFGCAIIGGFVVRDHSLGDLFGRYVYTDYCSGEIRSFAPAAPTGSDRSEGLSIDEPTSFGEDSCGRLYVAGREGLVARLVGASPVGCATADGPKGKPTYVGVRAQSRRVNRNKRALITAWVSPCKERKGDPVTLYRGRKAIGTRRLDRACTTRFRPRISRRWNFRATVSARSGYESGLSRKLTIKPRRNKPKQRRDQ